ncbi:MAG: GNAT family N-acetyltransferase [Bacteroidales bacterium]|jgi:ribosomal protein S18 acetylase RimI-like enzyme|nr:GNAT family N-acetyltransferase [Bacteroidales bacterium]
MNYRIREATEEDFPAVLSLIRELAEYEKASGQVTNSVEQMKREKEYFMCYVAENDKKEIIGMALFYFVYYTWVGKSLYLDDIYVRKDFRKNRVGSALMRKVFEVAEAENCKRIRWQVLDWNEPAIEMYRSIGAVIEDEWLNCTFDAEGISNFLKIRPGKSAS